MKNTMQLQKKLSSLLNHKEMKHIMQLYTNMETTQLQTNEAQFATTINWRLLCICKQMKHNMQTQNMKNTMQLETNEAHYTNANKESSLCKCKQMKHTTQLKKI